MLQLINYIAIYHTEKTAIGSIFFSVIGYLSKFTLITYTADERLSILFWFQLFAYIVSILVGIIAISGYIYKAYLFFFVKKRALKKHFKKK